MKLALAVLAAGLLVTQDDPRIRELVERLADDQITVREQAAANLAEFGPAAVPALLRIKSSGDPELSSRAASIIKRIGEGEIVGRHWRRGARITLDSDGTPVALVLEDLERQARDTFRYDPADLRDPVVLNVRDLPFWDCVDALCRAAPTLTWEVDGDVLVFTRRSRPAYPVRSQEEFTVWLDGITYTRDFDFTGNARTTFTVTLASAWESGIVPVAVEQRVAEVLDEEGRNLMPPDRFASYGARLETPTRRIRKEVAYMAIPQGREVRAFSKVCGSAAFYFPRSYEDVSIDLKSTSTPLQLERMTIAVRNFRVLKDACAFEIILTSAMSTGEPLIDRMPYGDIAVIDDQGNLCRSSAATKGPAMVGSSRSHSYSGTSYTIHENMQVPLAEGRTAVSLRLRLLKDVMEKRVAFEFSDIAVQ